MTMQLAFEHVSPDADRLSFQERSHRVGQVARPRRRAMPHVDDLLFAVSLAGLLVLGGAELRDGVDYALSVTAPATAVTAASSVRLRG